MFFRGRYGWVVHGVVGITKSLFEQKWRRFLLGSRKKSEMLQIDRKCINQAKIGPTFVHRAKQQLSFVHCPKIKFL